MSARSTLIRVELPLALRVIVAGVRTALVLIVGTAALASFTGAGGLGQLITTGIKLQQPVTLVVGAILVAALALFIDWLARVVEIIAAPRGCDAKASTCGACLLGFDAAGRLRSPVRERRGTRRQAGPDPALRLASRCEYHGSGKGFHRAAGAG